METERPATLDEMASSGPAVSPRCPLDVGCDEYGVCYAAAHDRPEMCPFAVDEEAIWEACSDAPPLTDAQRDRLLAAASRGTEARLRKRAACYSCALPYVDFYGDICLPDELWERINPSPHRGGGLLCPNCTMKALADVDTSDYPDGVPAVLFAVAPEKAEQGEGEER